MGQTPRSAADALVGLFGLDGVEFIGYRRVQGRSDRGGTRADQGVCPISANLSVAF
jgi:hypothetical protein